MVPQFTLDPPAAAEYLSVPEQTLRMWRSQRRGPKYRRLPNGKIRYAREHLDEFSAAHVVDPARPSIA